MSVPCPKCNREVELVPHSTRIGWQVGYCPCNGQAPVIVVAPKLESPSSVEGIHTDE